MNEEHTPDTAQTPRPQQPPTRETLEEIAADVALCTTCPLHEKRTKTVPGAGNPHAKLMFIGEGPGKNEDEQGLPFVGAAGKLLDELLASIALARGDVFIANVVKCRPPENRDPMAEEVEMCWPFLQRQVALIRPVLIVNLGRHSMDRFLPGLRISRDHGQPKRRRIPNLGTFVFYPIYHPAAALYQGSLRDVLFEDFARIPKILAMIERNGVGEVPRADEEECANDDEQQGEEEGGGTRTQGKLL